MRRVRECVFVRRIKGENKQQKKKLRFAYYDLAVNVPQPVVWRSTLIGLFCELDRYWRSRVCIVDLLREAISLWREEVEWKCTRSNYGVYREALLKRSLTRFWNSEVPARCSLKVKNFRRMRAVRCADLVKCGGCAAKLRQWLARQRTWILMDCLDWLVDLMWTGRHLLLHLERDYPASQVVACDNVNVLLPHTWIGPRAEQRPAITIIVTTAAASSADLRSNNGLRKLWGVRTSPHRHHLLFVSHYQRNLEIHLSFGLEYLLWGSLVLVLLY